MAAGRSVVVANKPKGLRRNANNLWIEIGQQKPVTFQQALVLQMSRRSQGPEQARIVLLARERPDRPDRLARNDRRHVHLVDRRQALFAIG